jgi:hypothetical protein
MDMPENIGRALMLTKCLGKRAFSDSLLCNEKEIKKATKTVAVEITFSA